MSIAFHFQKNYNLRARTKLKYFVNQLFTKENTPLAQLDYIFCSDAYLLKLNIAFLQHRYKTDVITFDLSDPRDTFKTAEIYISIDRIRKNAIDYQCTIQEEVHRAIFHGALHLCGYKDKTQNEKKEMRAKEDEYIQEYFKINVPRGTKQTPRKRGVSCGTLK